MSNNITKSLGKIKIKLNESSLLPSLITLTVLISQEEDGYVATCLELPGVVADGITYKETCKNIKDAIKFHIETFGSKVLSDISTVKKVNTANLKVVLSV